MRNRAELWDLGAGQAHSGAGVLALDVRRAEIADLEGILARPDGPSVSLDAMDAAVRKRASGH